MYGRRDSCLIYCKCMFKGFSSNEVAGVVEDVLFSGRKRIVLLLGRKEKFVMLIWGKNYIYMKKGKVFCMNEFNIVYKQYFG